LIVQKLSQNMKKKSLYDFSWYSPPPPPLNSRRLNYVLQYRKNGGFDQSSFIQLLFFFLYMLNSNFLKTQNHLIQIFTKCTLEYLTELIIQMVS